MWKHDEQFLSRISYAWQVQVRGTRIFSVVQRLENVKKELKELNKQGFCDIQAPDTKGLIVMHDA